MSWTRNLKPEMMNHSFPIKQRIFDHNYEYCVAKHVSDLWEKNQVLHIEVTLSNFQKATLEVSLLDIGVINIKYSSKKRPPTFNEYLNSKVQKVPLNYQIYDDKIKIYTPQSETLIVTKNPFKITLLDKKNQPKFQTNDRSGYEFLADHINPGLGFKIQEANYRQPFMSFWIENDEKLYGLGEKFRPLVKNGVESVIYNTDNSVVANHDLAYNGLPLLYSTKNWGVLLNTGNKTTFEIGSPTTDALSFLTDDEYLDLYFFTGDNIKEMIYQYTELTGKIKAIPDSAYGIWLNRLYFHNYNELAKEIANARQCSFPVDVITLDPKWLKNRFTKSCNFEYNTDAFGNFNLMFTKVKDKNLKMCFWINPYIQNDNSDNWKFLLKNNFLVKTTSNQFAHPWTGTETYQENNHLIDFTNPQAFQWYKEELKKLFKLGLRYLKPDYGDGLPEDALMYNGFTGKEFRQYYAYLYAKCCFEASEEYFGIGNTMILCRPGYIGTQKFPGKWSGDSISNFRELKNHLNAGLSLGLAGEIIWGTDIGGFKKTNDFTDDLFIRWIQIGMLTPFSRYHSIGKNEPWYFSNQVLDIAIKTAKLKKQLLPHYKIFEALAAKTGVPIMRPLVLENQNDAIAQKIDDQFYLGDTIMVAPILTANTTSRQVYFPKGIWRNFFDKSEFYFGERVYNIECPLTETLIFVKDGSIVVTLESGDYKFDDLNLQTLVIKKFGEIRDLVYKFKLNSEEQQIIFKNNNISVLTNLKFKII
ncbi:alpha-xylosidase [Mesoplasma syrphidae]|uniref:Alpha-xylosidase n=1 Tax=Mesoplasma syrphidae TaxID=225999 RepID=A0A2K9BRD3_9MOLU|nr:TIM-barrel domain-containing protein [Mesoplasma syrphidae]AUF83562.1 alpha-xylosidase [Mesoplasma syrphidae]